MNKFKRLICRIKGHNYRKVAGTRYEWCCTRCGQHDKLAAFNIKVKLAQQSAKSRKPRTASKNAITEATQERKESNGK